MESLINFLRCKALFGGLDDDALQKIVCLLKRDKFEKGAVIITEKDVGDRMYLIIKGTAEVLKYSEREKSNKQICLLQDGDSFGEMELIDIQPRTATVKALTDIETASLNSHDLLRLAQTELEIFSIVVLNVARIISRKLRKTDEVLVSR